MSNVNENGGCARCGADANEAWTREIRNGYQWVLVDLAILVDLVILVDQVEETHANYGPVTCNKCGAEAEGD